MINLEAFQYHLIDGRTEAEIAQRFERYIDTLERVRQTLRPLQQDGSPQFDELDEKARVHKLRGTALSLFSPTLDVCLQELEQEIGEQNRLAVRNHLLLKIEEELAECVAFVDQLERMG